MDDLASVKAELTDLKVKVEENTRILKAMRRDALIAGVVKFVVWLVVIFGSYFLAMQFIEPYLGTLESMSGQGGAQDWGALLRQYQELMGQ